MLCYTLLSVNHLTLTETKALKSYEIIPHCLKTTQNITKLKNSRLPQIFFKFRIFASTLCLKVTRLQHACKMKGIPYINRSKWAVILNDAGILLSRICTGTGSVHDGGLWLSWDLNLWPLRLINNWATPLLHSVCVLLQYVAVIKSDFRWFPPSCKSRICWTNTTKELPNYCQCKTYLYWQKAYPSSVFHQDNSPKCFI